MSILVVVETQDNEYKKSAYDAVAYAADLAKKLSKSVTTFVLGEVANPETIGNYGSEKVFIAENWDEKKDIVLTITQMISEEKIETVVFAKSPVSETLAARISVKTQSYLATNICSIPELSGSIIKIKKSIYTGKGFIVEELHSGLNILVIKKNILQAQLSDKLAQKQVIKLAEGKTSKLVSKGITKATGDILLTDAQIVVSGGRGMKGPENWALIEDLAKTLGAATGCSKPVSDMDWRPHHEHVGQTGVKVAPTLYIAAGISGAIQHLAGVNSSKFILVINKDPEAPFFKAADYGVVGDLFEVLPKLNALLKSA